MKVLFVVAVDPWPARDGYRIRTSQLIDALARAGEVTVLCITEVEPGPERPDGLEVRWARRTRITGPSLWWRWLRSGLPRRVVEHVVEDRKGAARIVGGDWDAVVFSHVDTWAWFADVVRAPVVVDLDNLEDGAVRAEIDVLPRGGGVVGSLKRRVRVAVMREQARRWQRLQRRCAASVGAVAVCSELDRRRLGVPNAVVVPNGATRQRHAPPSGPTEAPVFGFVGLLSYPPNADAVMWFASEVMPLVRHELPAASFRVVGAGAEHLPAGLECDLAGRVDDLGAELDRFDVMVVPIRFGAGTRLKVAEALANRVPCVSTTIGAEGIDVADGVEILMADVAASFAAACVRAAIDGDLRAALIAAGERCWETRYRWESIGDTFVSDVVEPLTSQGDRGIDGGSVHL
jgi:glycosyltransferase involved in cell wall biosynthesis